MNKASIMWHGVMQPSVAWSSRAVKADNPGLKLQLSNELLEKLGKVLLTSEPQFFISEMGMTQYLPPMVVVKNNFFSLILCISITSFIEQHCFYNETK